MSEPYKTFSKGDPILAEDWNGVQKTIRQHILSHTHNGTGESGAKLDISALVTNTSLAVRSLSAAESLAVGAPAQPILAVSSASGQPGGFQVRVVGGLDADRARVARLDGLSSLAVGSNVGAGTAGAPDALTVIGISTLGGNTSVAGTLKVAGDAAFAGVVTLSPSSPLAVGGPATFGAGLTVTGATTLGGTVTVNQGAPLTVTGATTLRGTLDVSSAATFGGAVNVSQSVDFGKSGRQMLNLWDTAYGIGVQIETLYFRSGGNFAWYRDGEHVSTPLTPGRNSGVVQMVIMNGNVGIGVAKPETRLEVRGGLTVLEQQLWQAITLSGTWQRFDTTYNPPEYFRDSQGIVHLRGLIKGGAVGYLNDAGLAFTLPEGFRPQNRELFIVISNDAVGRVDITSAGRVVVMSGNTAWVSLDNIRFRASTQPAPALAASPAVQPNPLYRG